MSAFMNRFPPHYQVTEHKPVAPYRYRYAPRRVPTMEQMIKDYDSKYGKKLFTPQTNTGKLL